EGQVVVRAGRAVRVQHVVEVQEAVEVAGAGDGEPAAVPLGRGHDPEPVQPDGDGGTVVQQVRLAGEQGVFDPDPDDGGEHAAAAALVGYEPRAEGAGGERVGDERDDVGDV